MKILDNLLSGYNSYMTYLSRVKAREVLLNSSDRTLEDLGISRQLLESGLKAWPWHKIDPEFVPLRFKQINNVNANYDTHAPREPQNYYDKNLNNPDTSKGSGVDAVISSRNGIENKSRERKVA